MDDKVEGPYLRTRLEELKYEFRLAYLKWVDSMDNGLYRAYEREEFWDTYCDVRDRLLLYKLD